MKIAIFSDCFLDLTGGIVTTISAQKEELEKRGHTVYVFSSAYPKTPKMREKLAKNHIFNVKSCRVWGRGLTPIARRPKIIEREILRNHPEVEDFDVFYVHYEAGCSIAGLRLGKRLKIPTIQVMHGREDIGEQNLIPRGLRTFVATMLNWFHSWYLPHPIRVPRGTALTPTIASAKMWTLMVNHANAANLVLTPSRHFKEKLESCGVHKTIKVLPNGVLDSLFTPNLKPKSLLPGETLKIIWHSRVSGEKRILPFLEALSMVNGKYHLDVYGDGNDFRKAQSYAREHDLSVTFHGTAPFSEIYPKIIASHLDVLASYNFDTFGMTLVEAESAGTPAFYVDPDLREVVPEGGAVLTSAPTPEAIAKSINGLLENPDKIEEMSQVMLEHRDEVKVSKVVDKLLHYIDGFKVVYG